MKEIPFIKDIDDYNNYAAKTPKKKYMLSKVKFICSCCKNESIKTFKYLSKEFLCGPCTNRRTQLTEDVRRRIEMTNYKKYGVKSPTQNIEVQMRQEQTTMKHFGVPRPFMSSKVKDKYIQTCRDRYGVDNTSTLDSTRKSVINTVKMRYGVNNVFQRSEFIDIQRDIHENIMDNRLKPLNLQYMNKDDNRIRLKCLSCQKEFSYGKAHFYRLIDSETKSFCPYCSRIIEPHSSLPEKEVINYISSIYNGMILQNNRTVLNGRELDIYIPELKIGIEFDGTYWHADPRFYDKDFIIMNRTAEEIWERDKEKSRLCENIGIKLIRIKEYDWLNDRAACESLISTTLVQCS